MTTNKAIDIRNISYQYSSSNFRLEALRDLTFSVTNGEIFGFIGPNGAGKTTTIKLLTNIHRVQKGEIYLLGASPEDKHTRRRIGFMPEIAYYYKYLTPIELLSFYGGIFGMEKKLIKNRVDMLLEKVGLFDRRHRAMNTFSKGMMQRVSFAQALMNDPELLILDEPTSGLDPVSRKRMREMLLEIKHSGKTVFFSSHELSEVELISDRIGILNSGKMVASGTASDLLGAKSDKQSLENYFLDIIGEKQ